MRPEATALERALACTRQLASVGSASVEGLLPELLASHVAAALSSVRLRRRAPTPRGLGPEDPGFMYYEAAAPHRSWRRAHAPICALASSFEHGPLRRLLLQLTGRTLAVRGVFVRAYVKGSHVARAGGPEAVWYGTPGWTADRGGSVRLQNGAELAADFNALHVFDARPREVVLVTEHHPLYVVRVVLGDA